MGLVSQTLGYGRMAFEDFGPAERSLAILDHKHEATRTLKVGDQITLKGPSSICTSDIDKGQILAKQTVGGKGDAESSKTFPAIVINNYGEGRAVYLNFSLEQSFLQNNEILLSLFNWLILQNTHEPEGKLTLTPDRTLKMT